MTGYQRVKAELIILQVVKKKTRPRGNMLKVYGWDSVHCFS